MNLHGAGVTSLPILQGTLKHKDPVCGMMVAPEKAAANVEYEGKTYYFCSKSCLQKFLADPAKFTKDTPKSSAPPASASGPIYTCPMHPEVRQDHPGTCPKCGMTLEPVGAAPAETKVEYSCPMHPQIVRDRPGSCPICGMALEPRTVTLEEGGNPGDTRVVYNICEGPVVRVRAINFTGNEVLASQARLRTQVESSRAFLGLPVGGTFNPANYAITVVNGSLTVTPAALTVTANDAGKTHGQTLTFASSPRRKGR